MYFLYRSDGSEVTRNKSISALWVYAYNNGLVDFGVVCILLKKGYRIKYKA